MKLDAEQKSRLSIAVASTLFGFILGAIFATEGVLSLISYLAIVWLIGQGLGWYRKRRDKKRQRQQEMEASLKKVAEAARGLLERMKQSSEKTETGSSPAAPAMVTGMGAIARAATEVSRSSSDGVRVPPYARLHPPVCGIECDVCYPKEKP